MVSPFRPPAKRQAILGYAPVPAGPPSGGSCSGYQTRYRALLIYFVVPKNDSAVRPILDLQGLSCCLRVSRFRMETLRSVMLLA